MNTISINRGTKHPRAYCGEPTIRIGVVGVGGPSSGSTVIANAFASTSADSGVLQVINSVLPPN